MSDELEIEYQEVKLAKLVEYWVKDYNPPPEHSEFFIDPVKGVVLLKLYVRTPEGGRTNG